MLELRQGFETLQSSEMMPKPTSTQISSPGDIGKGVFQYPHFQSNCLHIYIYRHIYRGIDALAVKNVPFCKTYRLITIHI
jgi:hypothetical protein